MQKVFVKIVIKKKEDNSTKLARVTIAQENIMQKVIAGIVIERGRERKTKKRRTD